MTEEVLIARACIALRRPAEPLEEQLAKIQAQAGLDGIWGGATTVIALTNMSLGEQEHFMRWARGSAPLSAWAIYEDANEDETYAGWIAWTTDALETGLKVYAERVGQVLTNVTDIESGKTH